MDQYQSINEMDNGPISTFDDFQVMVGQTYDVATYEL
jgi:hypothetical protein